ncbi:universal stress protein [Dehalogenimonas etheniformans]|uniref:Universal stress protein n=1 Tax=Dehalogenimonas etheniformans TaxID=1536648 RepID=A0A2P5P6E5_9CHLR|nr:universal stress protein [Dehalogenimonas etheniformans]PPD57881.1 universal stress protein [Dehalogenimonas etheniformans]QNT75466.1 universal stress protein [Dehalogenimonas etheniformans]
MFGKILYPTDFSEPSQKALDSVRRLFQGCVEEILVLHVFDRRELRNLATVGGIIGKYPIDLDEEFNRLESEHLTKVKKIVDDLKSVGFAATGIVREGIPLREILNVADEEKASVIVLGSHGKSNFEEVILGSVSEGVIKQSQQPVLVIKRDTRRRG